MYVKCEEAGEGARTLICDTGRGIAEDERSLLFEEFRQVGDRVHTKEGTGMGVYITLLRVEVMGGKGKPERGEESEFVVELRKG